MAFSVRGALVVLLLASLGFYAWHVPLYLPLLIGVSGAAYVYGQLIDGVGRKWRWPLTLFTIGLVLAPLLVFKYTGFVFQTAAALGLAFDGPDDPALADFRLLLPLGISFFTFQNLGYVADRFRGTYQAVQSALNYAVYITFFPQLVAGPIVAARDFVPQLQDRTFFHNSDFVRGSFYLLSGYGKKALLADHLALVVDPSFAAPGDASAAALLLAVLAYAMQIYFDFSGYSDIAIGLGWCFGLRLPENFQYPYSAASLREFWRRWHITLSRWLRDQLYIPLGGSRLGPGRMYFALIVTMALGGLWHGAHWNFALWGLGHGVLLALERQVPQAWFHWRVFAWFYRSVVLAAVVLLWVPFRGGAEPDAVRATFTVYERLFCLAPGDFSEGHLRLVVAALLVLALGSVWGEALRERWAAWPAALQAVILALAALLLLLFTPGTSGFIYFVF